MLVAGYLPPLVALVVAVAGGIIVGGAYGFVPGFLKARTGAHEVITTLMLNGIAPSLAFLIVRFDRSPGSGGGDRRRAAAHRPARRSASTTASSSRSRWPRSSSVLLFRTTLGFELRATGFSHAAARWAGMRPGRTTMLAMSLSGGLVGMGAAFFALGPAPGLLGGPESDLGYVAIALALLAGRRPSGVVVAAILYGALTTGAKSMTIATGIPLALLTVIVAFAIMFVAAPQLTRSIWRLRPSTPRTEAVGNTPGPAASV